MSEIHAPGWVALLLRLSSLTRRLGENVWLLRLTATAAKSNPTNLTPNFSVAPNICNRVRLSVETYGPAPSTCVPSILPTREGESHPTRLERRHLGIVYLS